MVTDEVKKSKRIRRKVNRSEIFHLWANTPTYHYYDGGNNLTSMHGFLFVGKHKSISKEAILSDWSWKWSKVCAGIIDYEKKLALIYSKYEYYYTSGAIGDEYDYFITDEYIKSGELPDIKELIKLNAIYLVNQEFNYNYAQRYLYLAGCVRKVRIISDRPTCLDYRKSLSELFRHFKLKTSDLYTKPLKDTVTINVYGYRCIKIPCPSVKRILEDKVFTKKERRILAIGDFYTKWCYGNGISKAKIESIWDKDLDENLLKDLCKHYNVPVPSEMEMIDDKPQYHYRLDECLDEHIISKCQDVYRYCIEYKNLRIAKYRRRNLEISDDNRRKAYEKLHALNKDELLAIWRGESDKRLIPISYSSYSIYNDSWKVIDITKEALSFNDVYLRLINNHAAIETTRGARVPYLGAIRLFDIFNDLVRGVKSTYNPGVSKIVLHSLNNLEFNINIHHNELTGYSSFHLIPAFTFRIGYYQLRELNYTYNTNIKHHDWLFVIGCHNIWLTNFIEFVNHYKLNNDFIINNNYQITF